MIELSWDLITPSVHCDACMYAACTMIVMEVHSIQYNCIQYVCIIQLTFLVNFQCI